MPQLRVILADDERDHAVLLSIALKRAAGNIHIDMVETGEALISALHEGGAVGYDCAIVDFNLSDFRAIEVMQKLADMRINIPVVVVSCSNEQQVVIESMRHGCVDFLPKEEAVLGDYLWKRVSQAIQTHSERNKERRKMNRRLQQLARLAETDPLTGLGNRRHVNTLLDNRRNVFDRRGRTACIMIDIDHFKNINDTHGHDCGDQVLRHLADFIKSNIPRGSEACRWGGEEFLIILPQTAMGQAFLLADRLRRNLSEQSIRTPQQTLKITASMGVSDAASELFGSITVGEADQALYLAKKSGRNRVCHRSMVGLDMLVGKLQRSDLVSPYDRLHFIINQGNYYLGTTQFDHLTLHSQRVGELALMLGGFMGFEPQRKEQLRLAGLYHDIGKFLIPEDILSQSTPLNDSEKKWVGKHVHFGRQIALQLGLKAETADAIYHHHTRYDGKGQVTVASPTEIPFTGRLLCVCDALITMLTERSYKQARSLNSSLMELRRHRGGQFDPTVLTAVYKLISAVGPQQFLHRLQVHNHDAPSGNRLTTALS